MVRQASIPKSRSMGRTVEYVDPNFNEYLKHKFGKKRARRIINKPEAKKPAYGMYLADPFYGQLDIDDIPF